MALFISVKIENGKIAGWRAVVRIKGYPTVCKQFERKQEADDWATSSDKTNQSRPISI